MCIHRFGSQKFEKGHVKLINTCLGCHKFKLGKTFHLYIGQREKNTFGYIFTIKIEVLFHLKEAEIWTFIIFLNLTFKMVNIMKSTWEHSMC